MRETGILPDRAAGGLPTISDYADALSNPYGRFRTLAGVEAETDARGELVFFAGNTAGVFPVATAEGWRMLKCYIKQGLHAEQIYAYIAASPDPLLATARLLGGEIYVYDIFGNGGYFDVVCSPWVVGVTLETAIRSAARGDRFTFAELSAAFDAMASELLAREWAHGDLKPENIIVRPDGSLCLIDYDAMFIPALAGRRTAEVGTPQYQHPGRNETTFDKSIDDYPAALISVSLRALALDPGLYAKYNRTDNVILYPADVLSGGSEAYAELLRLFAGRGMHRSYELALALQTPVPRIGNLPELLRSERSLAGEEPAVGLCADHTAGGGTAIRPESRRCLPFRCGLRVFGWSGGRAYRRRVAGDRPSGWGGGRLC